MKQRKLIGLSIFAVFMGSVVVAQAQPSYLRTLVSLYPERAAALQRNGCLNCHASEDTMERNAYGRAVEKALLTCGEDNMARRAIKRVEGQSAAPGGRTFLSKIEAGQNPGVEEPTGSVARSPVSKARPTTKRSNRQAAPRRGRIVRRRSRSH